MDSFVDVYEEHTGRIPIVHLMEGWELTAPWQRTGVYEQFKRPLDVLLVLATSPIWFDVRIVVVAGQAGFFGSCHFQQERVGRYGKSFTLYKFRSMIVEAEARWTSQDHCGRYAFDSGWPVHAQVSGRRASQLWNVLVGDLSLVGPRPEQRIFVDDYAERIPFYTNRHRVRPGVTGWAQVSFGYADDEVATVEKLSYDLYYVKHVTPWLDLSILGRSVWTVLSGFGAQ